MSAGPFPYERPLVLGSGGRAGAVLAERLSDLAPETVAATRAELDITDSFNLLWEFERLRPDLVINAAAGADVDACQADPAAAALINIEGAANAARAAAACGARFVHFSTDYVFDGTRRLLYTEADEPRPLSVYGATKWQGERAVLAAYPTALVVRTAWLFGGRSRRRNLMEGVLAAARSTGRVQVPADQTGSPTGVGDLADGVLALLRTDAQGIVHCVCKGEVSRLEFARAVLRLAGLESVEVLAGRGARPDAAPRPAFSALDTSRLTALTGVVPRDWREALWDAFAERRGD